MALARLRQRPHELQRAPQMANGFLVRRALRGALAGPLVVCHRLRRKTRLIVVPRDHLGRGRDALGEAFFQHLGDARVELLARALEQRLVRRVLDQRVLEGVGRRRRRAALVEQLGVHQLRQSGVQARCLLQRDAASSS